ncbi:hypothetical protein G3R48_08485 [Shewanella intestini]|uniref:Transcription elongation factor GreAB n=2 Tax=Shewanellaceae TaxID=267890 RepID=A0ABS5I1Y3_9GAMM|nr:hypothetical protein [Shewanella intestini]MRG36431.1 hypothetical protein [Shewanella sp. XMDDZSB0408]
MPTKAQLMQQLQAMLSVQRQTALDAAQVAHNDATNEQSVAETQYDTIGLEAAYLAHGQSQRVADIDAILQQLASLLLRDFSSDDNIALTAIITLEGGMTCWLLPACGGYKLSNDNIIVITPQSPLGKKLDGAMVNDTLDDGRKIISIS